MNHEQKTGRLESLIRELVSSLILKGAVKDPRVGPFVTIVRVEIASDTTRAKVYVSCHEGERRLKEAADALNRAAGFIQGKMGTCLRTRKTPRLSFFADDSLEKAFRCASMKGGDVVQ